jgi:alcohol dehydrogenase
MSLGSVYAGLAFAPTRTAAVHACSYAISNQFDVPHGEACAFTLGFFLKENAEEDKRLNILAKDLGFKNVDGMVDKIESLKKKFNLKTTLKDLGCVDVGKLVKECVYHPLFNNNPKKYTEESLTKALKKYFKN